jgi:signal transduction histidine kinase
MRYWLDSIDEGVLFVEGGRVRFINRAAARLLEVDAEQRDLPLIAVVRDHRLERIYFEGGEVELETRGRVLFARAMPAGLLLRDLTELREAQTSARELLAVLSHELRTPVTTIRATLEALRYELPEAQREHFLSRALAESDRLVRLLEDLTVDVKPPVLRRIALAEIASRAAALLQDTFAAANVTLRCDVPPLTVLADTDKLLQVLINLLENAAIHGPKGKTVRLVAWRADSEAKVLVAVRDEGEPLNPDIIDKLFEPHARGPSVKARGTGLGLYIVRSIATRWGGAAWGRPLEAGNEFGFSVPLA